MADDERTPTKGGIYTIRTIAPGVRVETKGQMYLRFEEIINPIKPYWDKYGEAQFLATKFRPIDETYGEEVCSEIEKTLTEEPQHA